MVRIHIYTIPNSHCFSSIRIESQFVFTAQGMLLIVWTNSNIRILNFPRYCVDFATNLDFLGNSRSFCCFALSVTEQDPENKKFYIRFYGCIVHTCIRKHTSQSEDRSHTAHSSTAAAVNRSPTSKPTRSHAAAGYNWSSHEIKRIGVLRQ